MPKESQVNKPSGFLLINKPSGPTSHDIVDRLRQIISIKTIGHAGTLDPFASGLLIVAIGRPATRAISRFVKLDKTYEAVLRLGAVSDTYDRTGKLKVKSEKLKITREDIINLLCSFIGIQEQVPPMYSAKKVGGKKLYQLARQGKEIERKPEKINIEEIKILKYEWPKLNLRVKCSSGTYIRALAHDIGKALKCGAYLEELRRTAIGEYQLKNAHRLMSINETNWPDLLFIPSD